MYLTREPPAPTRYLAGLTVESAMLPSIDRWRAAGLPVTSLRRTVADCLRHLHPADALAVLDGALSGTRGVGHDVAAVLEACAAWPFASRATRLLRLGDGRRESPLESWSAWEMHRLGVSAPEPQVQVYDELGNFIGRVDFWWERHAVAGEADGKVKYDVTQATSPAQVRNALVAEKQREDRLRSTGIDVVRWGADDLRRPEEWAKALRRRLDRRLGGGFRGRAVPVAR